MARAGLGPDWRCLFANDFDHKKGRTYRGNWGDAELKIADVRTLTPMDIPGRAVWLGHHFPARTFPSRAVAPD